MTRTKRLPSTPQQIDAAVATSSTYDPCRWATAHEIDPTLKQDRWRERIPAHVLIEALLADEAHKMRLIQRLHDEIYELRAEVKRLRDAARVLNEAVDLGRLFDLEETL